mgnify:FL=1
MGVNYLIDTHVLLWWLFNDPKLCNISRDILKNPQNNIFVSSASAWEIATKHRIGKMPEAEELLANYEILLKEIGFTELSVSTKHALKAGSIEVDHRDPFDRMLMAQAEIESMPIITYDKVFHKTSLNVIPPNK